jgi:hypothetical protein
MALFENVILGGLFILLVALLLSLIVWAIIYGAAWFGFALPAQIQKILWAIVGVIVLAMLIALLFAVIRGVAPYHPFRADAAPVASRTVAALPAPAARHLPRLLS